MQGLDIEIEQLVEFLNQLDGINTIGSCQGHDDGGESGEWIYPYIKFKCTNNQTLGFLASLEDAYKSINEQAESKYFDPSLAYEPDLNGAWCIEVRAESCRRLCATSKGSHLRRRRPDRAAPHQSTTHTARERCVHVLAR